MSPFIIAPLITALSVSVLIPLLTLGGKQRAGELSERGIYVVAKGVKIFAFCGTLGLILMPVLIHGKSNNSEWLLYLTVDAMMVVACWYVYRFRLELRSSSFEYRALWSREINYADVDQLKWVRSGKGNNYLVVVLSSKKVLKISDAVQDLSNFADKLGRQVDEVTGKLISSGLIKTK